MRYATIQRKESGDPGTFGVLSVAGSAFKCVTGELPWRNNIRSVSCIRPGSYVCLWQFSPAHHRQVYELQNVPARNDVQIHSGNWCGDKEKGLRSDVAGCILLGDVVGVLDGQKAVLHSKKTVRDFEDEMKLEPFTLTILAVPGEENI